MNDCYLDTQNPKHCYGCESCVQVCSKSAIIMVEDREGFRYPWINHEECINCGLCRKVCPHSYPPTRPENEKLAWGGYHKNATVRAKSTSGGAFSAIVDAWCDENYAIFGAIADGLEVRHEYITDKSLLDRFRRSKYSQSNIGTAYADVRKFLKERRKVLFSGTPCHIAALKSFLRGKEYDNLLTVEVVCEGVPSPWYIRKYVGYLEKRYDDAVTEIDYRYPDSKPVQSDEDIVPGKWDFQVMQTSFRSGRKEKLDRWFNPFWSVWLQHLISRPSCYECPFASTSRNADITMGDLWGVHIYCPDLYGKNGGSSLVVCNSEKGKNIWKEAQSEMFGRELEFSTALKYQGPMRNHISMNPARPQCMEDLLQLDYEAFNRKWAKPPSLKLLWQKYIWGNRQKIWWWNLKNKIAKQ